MAEDPYRDDREAVLQRAAELEQEVQRLRQELEAVAATERRARDEAAETEEVKALRIANASLRDENEELRERLERARRNPTPRRPITVTVPFALVTIVVICLLIVLLTQK